MYLCGKRYRVIGRLGEGGFGSVYLAEDTLLGRTWAIKEVEGADEASLAAARTEISVLSRASHPGIVRITDVFRSDDHIYIVMDHIKGMSLKEIIRSKKRIPEKIIYRWSEELCEAVSYLHRMEPPVILRDIKPQNIMVRPDGHIVLIDFGAASIAGSDSGYLMGSRKYASPEQLAGSDADARSDIYSLGRVIDEMTGKSKPFGLRSVIRRCTMREPCRRYKSVEELMRDLGPGRRAGRLLLCLTAVILGIIISAEALGIARDSYDNPADGVTGAESDMYFTGTTQHTGGALDCSFHGGANTKDELLCLYP